MCLHVCIMPSRDNYEMALQSLQNIKESETSRESAFFGNSTTLSASFEPERSVI